MQPSIDTVAVNQFAVDTHLSDSASFEHDQAVGPAQRAEAVGDRDRRAALDQILQRLLDLQFRLGVDRRSRLVEDEDGGIDQQRAGNRDALTFSAREVLASFATTVS